MRKTALMLAAAVAVGMLGWSTAEAMPIGSGAPVAEKQANANIETVSHRRHWRNRHHGGWRHHRHNDAWRYGGPFLAGVLVGSAFDNRYDDDYYDYPRRRYRVADDDHVSYCLDRYRSYNVRTNTFLGYDGLRHRCNSPYN